MEKQNESKKIKEILDKTKVKRPIVQNIIQAFLVGGLISVIGQALLGLYGDILGLTKDLSVALVAMTLVFLASLLTGIGVYDRLGQFGGAGTIIPITGFSNSMTAAALESKSEGVILGIMANMFKLAGAIVVSGVVSALICSTIILLVR